MKPSLSQKRNASAKVGCCSGTGVGVPGAFSVFTGEWVKVELPGVFWPDGNCPALPRGTIKLQIDVASPRKRVTYHALLTLELTL
jgi:hypothetical protein